MFYHPQVEKNNHESCETNKNTSDKVISTSRASNERFCHRSRYTKYMIACKIREKREVKRNEPRNEPL